MSSDESRVDRLLRKAEEAADNGETDKAETYLEILHPAIYLRNREAKDMRQLVKGDGNGRHRRHP